MEALELNSRVLVLCVGNIFRCDDAVGHAVADQLRRKSLPGISITEENGEGAALMDRWAGAEAVILVDAVSSGGVPGSIYRFDVHEKAVPAGYFHYSSHAFSVAEAVEMARTLGRLPRKMILYGIEGKNFRAGSALSPEVKKSVPGVVQSIITELASLTSN